MASSSSDNITQSRTSSSSSSGLEPKGTFTSEKSLLPKTTEQVDVPRHWHCRRNEEVEGRILTEADLGDKNPKNFKLRLKVAIILVTALVQISMNLNASIFGNAYSGLQEKYGFTNDRCRLFTALFLIAYAFGCELWAPWSEELGRKKTLGGSLGLVNLWQVPQWAAVKYAGKQRQKEVFSTLLAFRVLGGASSAGGSITLAIVADLFGQDNQQHAMAFIVFASVMGSVVGPVAGGFVEQYLTADWVIAIQFIAGMVAFGLYICTPETRSSVLVTREARRRREEGREQVWSQDELDALSMRTKEYWIRVASVWKRPFVMFVTEPIVLALSAISGFSDALIFTFLYAMPVIMDQWGFSKWQKGSCFCSIGLGYCIGWAIWECDIYSWKSQKERLRKRPELRLRWLLWTAIFLPVAMMVFAWTATGPPMHFMVSQVCLVFVGIANYAIYGSTVDYMVAAYGEKYSASATGGNGFARDMLAGVSAFYAEPLYQNPGRKAHMNLTYGSVILSCIAFVLIIPIYVFYFKGESFRNRSKYAKEVKREREAVEPISEPTSGTV